jgi:hypothetical protein
MELQLYSLGNAPLTLPIWQLILEDIGSPSADGIARVLGVSPRTVYRWNRDDSAPRMAQLALFWLTRWGVSRIDAQAVNDARMALGMLRCLESERDRLTAQVTYLESLNLHGSANSPLIGRPR